DSPQRLTNAALQRRYGRPVSVFGVSALFPARVPRCGAAREKDRRPASITLRGCAGRCGPADSSRYIPEETMSDVQQGILAPIDTAARYLTFTISDNANVAAALRALREFVDGRGTVAGFGHALAAHLGRPVLGLTEYPAFAV